MCIIYMHACMLHCMHVCAHDIVCPGLGAVSFSVHGQGNGYGKAYGL